MPCDDFNPKNDATGCMIMRKGMACRLLPLHRLAAISNGWFDRLPEVIRADVLTRAKRHTLLAGQCLFSRGDEPRGIYRVLEGCVRLTGLSINGMPVMP
jgi:CRP-like cAMP-binding protein